MDSLVQGAGLRLARVKRQILELFPVDRVYHGFGDNILAVGVSLRMQLGDDDVLQGGGGEGDLPPTMTISNMSGESMDANASMSS